MAALAVAARTTPARVVPAEFNDRFHAILSYWFGANYKTAPVENFALWYGGAPETDKYITETFKADVLKAEKGEYVSWAAEPLPCLALTILLDQFALNIYRDQPQGYEVSASAIPLVYTAIGRGFDKQLHETLRFFFYLPLMHSEHIEDQRRCVELTKASEFAQLHHDIVLKHGRFPGRNKVMGRTSTVEELEYLAAGGEF